MAVCLAAHCMLILQFMIQSLCKLREFFLCVTSTDSPHCLMITTLGKAQGYRAEFESLQLVGIALQQKMLLIFLSCVGTAELEGIRRLQGKAV